MKPCKDCGLYEALEWGQGYCLRCWFKSNPAPRPAEDQIEIVEGPDWPDSIDDHPFATVTQADIDSYAEDDDNLWLPCGCHYTCCTCEGSDPVDMGREDDGYFG